MIMGLFDFFKPKEPPQRNNLNQPEREGPSPEYVFAHVALRHMALSDPLHFLMIMASPQTTDFLAAVLKDVEEQCGKPTAFSVRDIKVHPTRVDNYPCAIIEFPEPEEMAEAIMVALVVYLDPTAESPPEKKEELQSRYFTLEKGFHMSGEARTVLCEWTTQMHRNFGDGPTATVENFAEAISSHL